MYRDLAKLLHKFRKEIIGNVAQRLHASGGKHRQLMAAADIYPQAEELFNACLDSIRDNDIEVFANYAEGRGVRGFHEGYGLEELEQDLNCLAESLWEVISGNLENKLIPQALESVNKRIFRAKDKLARVYMDQCLKVEEKLLHLKREFEDFLKTRDIK